MPTYISALNVGLYFGEQKRWTKGYFFYVHGPLVKYNEARDLFNFFLLPLVWCQYDPLFQSEFSSGGDDGSVIVHSCAGTTFTSRIVGLANLIFEITLKGMDHIETYAKNKGNGGKEILSYYYTPNGACTYISCVCMYVCMSLVCGV